MAIPLGTWCERERTRAGHPALTSPGRPHAAVRASMERGDDPEDVYRAYLPAHGKLVVDVRTSANVNLEVWGRRTRTVFERGAAARRDLLGVSAHAGARPERIVVKGRRLGQYVFRMIGAFVTIAFVPYAIAPEKNPHGTSVE